jgi:integrase
MYYIGGRKIRMTIGTTLTIPKVEEARALAREAMLQAQAGIHPVEQRREAEREAEIAGETIASAIARYLVRHAEPRMRPDYFKETKRTLERDVVPALGARPVRDITRRDIRELVAAIVDRGSPSHACHVQRYLSAMLTWAVGEDLIPANPCIGLPAPAKKVERDRALDDDEIRLFWLACERIGWPFRDLFRLLLLTAARRDEVAEARWSEFDLDKGLWILPRTRSKNDKANLVHLSPPALAILASLPRIGDAGFVFTTNGETSISGFSHGAARLRKAMLEVKREELIAAGRPEEAASASIGPFTLHDLRRSAATGMAELGIAPHVIDKMLNHVGAAVVGVARIYNRAELLPERKAAAEAWAAHIEALVEPPVDNVVRLTAARA